jgi:hypothetical protein
MMGSQAVDAADDTDAQCAFKQLAQVVEPPRAAQPTPGGA